MTAKAPDADTSQLEPIQDRVSVSQANQLLNQFAKSKLDVSNDLVERVEKLTAGKETCYRIVDKELIISEEVVERTVPRGRVGSSTFYDQFVDYDIEQRSKIMPEDFHEAEFKYLLPDSIETVQCTQCVSGTVDCSKCGGDGRVNCRRCGGRGLKRGSETGENCSSCKGRGTHVCSRCTAGQVSCSACAGEGKRASYQYISRSYKPVDSIEYVTTLKEEYLDEATGTIIRKTSAEATPPAIKREIELYSIEATRLNYTVDSEEYHLAIVEGLFKYENYPKTKWRTLLPYAAAGAAIVIILLVMAYVGGI